MKPLKRAIREATAWVTRAAHIPPYHAPVPQINRWAVDAGPARRRIHGVDFELDLGEHVQRYIYYSGHEPDFTREFLSVLSPGATVIDAGAHIGYFALLAARRVGPSGRVLAVEPIPSNAARIHHNARRNGLAWLEVEEVALGAMTGELVLHGAGNDNEGTYSVSAVDADVARKVRVPMTTLDALVAARGVRPDVIKIDVQGAEFALLQGAERALSMARLVFCEVHPRHLQALGSGPGEVFDLLTRRGFVPGRIEQGVFAAQPVAMPTDEAMIAFAKG